MTTTKQQARTNLATMPRSTGKVLKRAVDAMTVGKQVVAHVGKSGGKSVDTSFAKANRLGKAPVKQLGGTKTIAKTNAKTNAKSTKREQYRKWERTVKGLADVDPKKLFPFAVVHRKIKEILNKMPETSVQHVSSEYVVILHEALNSYLFKFYENAYNATVKSGHRTTLMVRDLHAVYQAMGDSVVEPKREASPAVDADDVA